jgi:hypothetical protein
MNGRLTTAINVTVYDVHKNDMYTDSPLDLQDAVQKKEGCSEWAVKDIQWNLGSRTPLFTNNSVHEQIFRAKKSRMTNGVSDYEHASRQQRQAESIGAGVSVAG